MWQSKKVFIIYSLFFPALKTGFQISIQILKNLVPVLVYSLLTLWILVVVGFHIKSYQKIQNAPSTTRNNCQIHINANNETLIDTLANQYPYESEELKRNYEPNLPHVNSGGRVNNDGAWNNSNKILSPSSGNDNWQV